MFVGARAAGSGGAFKGRYFLNHPEKLWDRVGAGVVWGGVEALVAARRALSIFLPLPSKDPTAGGHKGPPHSQPPLPPLRDPRRFPKYLPLRGVVEWALVVTRGQGLA